MPTLNSVFLSAFLCACSAVVGLAQSISPGTATLPSASLVSEYKIDAIPLRPFDPKLVFASPKDASRYQLQSAAAILLEKRDITASVRLLLQAALIDRDNFVALFDLAILTQRRGDWNDAQGFLEEVASRGAGELKILANRELERVRMIADLERTEDGRRKRKYDSGLLAAFDEESTHSLQTNLDAYGDLIKLDNKRWEAPARVGAILADQERFNDAARYLAAALAVAPAASRATLQTAASEARKESSFVDAKTTAEAAWEAGNYHRSAESYERSWRLYPDRTDNGFLASTSALMYDDVPGATKLLALLRDSSDDTTSRRALAMLKELSTIDAQAAAESVNVNGSPHRTQSTSPVLKISALVPDPVTPDMRIAARRSAELVWDDEPAVTAQSLAEDAEIAAKASTPAADSVFTPYPLVSGEHPLSEYQQFSATGIELEAPVQYLNLLQPSSAGGKWRVDSTPAGAELRVDGLQPMPGGILPPDAETKCRTPCEVTASLGTHAFSFSMPGFEPLEKKLLFKRAPQANTYALVPARGKLLIETSAPGAIVSVNGDPTSAITPCRLVLPVGTYNFAIETGGLRLERQIMIRDDLPLKVVLVK